MMVASATEYAVWSALLVVGASLDATYCGLETGVYHLNKIRLELQADRGRASAVSLQRLLGRFNHLLAVLLIGTNLSRYMATFAVSAMFVLAGFEHNAEWLTLAAVTPLMFVVGDSVPKNVFQRTGGAGVYRLAWMVRLSSVVFTACGLAPLVQGFSSGLLRLLGRTDGDHHPLGHRGIESVVAEGRASGLLTDYQSAMADRAVRIADLKLRDVMAPMARAVTAKDTVSRDELLDVIRHYAYSRLPLLDATGTVVAILDVFDLLVADPDTRPQDLARPPLVLPDRQAIGAGLLEIQRAGSVMAIVADAQGRHVGIVTIKDIVEQIVGELVDEGD